VRFGVVAARRTPTITAQDRDSRTSVAIRRETVVITADYKSPIVRTDLV
jgi:hypothetical protein